MEKVFSRWPSQVQPFTLIEAVSPAGGFPQSMLASQGARSERLRNLWTAVLLPASAAVATGLLIANSSGIEKPLAVLAALAVMAAVTYTMGLRRALARSNARYDAIFERAGISMWLEDWSAAAREVSSLLKSGVHDMESHFATRPDELRALCAKVMIKDVNAFTVQETGAPGKEAFIGSLDHLIPPTDQTFVQWLVAFARGDRFFRSEAHITTPDGSEVDALFTAALPSDLDGFENILVTSLDITGYKSEQAKLLAADAAIARASRISTVGALSASIAHEVNSPLAAVLANAQAALRWLQRGTPDIDEATEAVSAIVSDATGAKDIVARTRAFLTNAPIAMAPFDVVAAAREANLLVERELRNCGAVVNLQAELELPAVKGDVIQIQQVFTNLLLNAAQAMAGQAGAKVITLSFKADGQSIQVEIADTGPGIDRKQLERVFDPFYTTRPDGIGMGLAICRNCIDAQAGNIWATSGPNHGATIHFTLPMHDD
jgi:signal transduction histidine kinase